MTDKDFPTTLPDFSPDLPGFKAEEFLTLTETLLAVPNEQNQAALDAAPFRLVAPEPLPEGPLPPLPPRWYPRPVPEVLDAARAALAPPPKPAVFEGRMVELERVLRPLLAGHPMRVHGEMGVGKTTLLAAVATHERTRGRFRRVWWIDRPARLDQTLALALNLPHALAESDPTARRAILAEHLDDHTLLIVDNTYPGDPALDGLLNLTQHVLLGVDTAPEVLDPDEPLPDDPEGVVTLRVFDDTSAINVLALYGGIEDTRKIRGDLMRIANTLGNYPLALMLAGKLISRDGLSLDDLQEALVVRPAAGSSEDEDEEEKQRRATLNRALDVSVAALPGDYRTLFEAFGAFPSEGVPLDGLLHTARIGSLLATRRGLILLAEYGFIRADHRDPQFYVMHPAIHIRAAEDEPYAPKHAIGKRMHAWALNYARDNTDNLLALYRAETALRFASETSTGATNPLLDVLRPYLREYVPGAFPDDDTPWLDKTRSEGATLTQYGLELTDQGAYFAAEEALSRALEIRRAHDSNHAVAETLVALGRLYDISGRCPQAAESLVNAAELVYNLGAEPSLSVIRRGLARVYRHIGHLNEGLGVLDESPDAHLERAAILRAQGNYSAAVEEIVRAEDATPYLRAELFLLAGRYADALQAISGQDDPASAHLRAQVFWLQGAVDEAIAGYEQALDCYEVNDPAREKTLRALGSALAGVGRFDEARNVLEAALDIHRATQPPDSARHGRTLRLLAAVYLIAGEPEHAAETAQEAVRLLREIHAPDDTADAYRTLGRALWRMGNVEGALEAFVSEVDFAQSMPDRDEMRIGTALHHAADAYRATGNLDRAVANYRRALSHKNANTDPTSYFITQLALHRALVEANRLPTALDVAQEIIDLLVRQPQPDLMQVGYAQAIRARTEQAAQRPIRAAQSFGEWTRVLTARAAEAIADPRPPVQVLILGLAVRSLIAENRPALALKLAERSLEIAEEHFPDTSTAWAARRDYGELLMALDRREDALSALEPLLEDRVKSDPATYALAQAISGQAWRDLGDLGTALKHLRAAFETEPEAPLRGLLLEQIAAIQLEMGQPNEAVETLREALPLLPRETHVDAMARVLTTLAHTLGGLNRYAEAIGVYENALAALRDVQNVSPTHTADVLRSLGATHEAQGQYADAARAYRRALNVLERSDSPRQTRDILHQLARVMAAQGDGSAVSLYEQTRDLTRQVGSNQELGEVLCELGDVHRDSGRFALAVQNYQVALDNQPTPIFARNRVNTLRNLGRAYAQMERYDEARAAWTEALDLSNDLPDQSPLETALTYHAIAEAHRIQGHTTDAELSYREALRYHEAGSVAAAATWRALGLCLHAAGRSEDALEPLIAGLEAEKAQPQQANARIVQTLQALAAAYEAGKDLPSAITRHHEALVYMDRKLQPAAYAETLRTLGRLYGVARNYAEAHTALNEALEIESTHPPRSDERISTTLQMIADTYRAEGDLEKAAEFYSKVTAYSNLARRASQDLKETLDELERRRATLQAAHQSLALLERSDSTGIKDLAFIYALIAKSHASLNQPRESAETIRSLLVVLANRRESLKVDDEQADVRALAYLCDAGQAQDTDDLTAARTACAAALQHVRNANLRWVIEQVARAVE